MKANIFLYYFLLAEMMIIVLNSGTKPVTMNVEQLADYIYPSAQMIPYFISAGRTKNKNKKKQIKLSRI